ncbi:nitrate ABC transporter permease [Vibrio navarrensis]|uniref:Nitrate ABC transporter permease n=1 Tax=Vibrio navarrensis TaxID=29495 RepID=A0A099LUK8_9VIBR|nr:ABC transporter permease [Vibrio navarrensis]KGK11151.1 nitrate ABC transporter permease [Vibrio navarrensis]MBE4579815.1 nitrate ABC transporter permease [Vibrio navarrensis]MBE4584957.1 nitrate ABC transporter permease [Vibrio navarrensis]MBE4613624.1 nitrate ABC transporter permease [Vibrio navarrensis]QOD68922.1 ABC transporter permease [Vibrio navarrensis]
MSGNVISLIPSPQAVVNHSRLLLLPLIGILLFLLAWHLSARQVETSLGTLPGPAQTYQQFVNLLDEHQHQRDKAQRFIERQEKRNAQKLALDPSAEVKIRPYTGKPTFFDQIATSLVTVACGFLLASVIAIPIGILLGLNQGLYLAFNPIIQLLKPVSPLAWLPIVTMVVSATYVSDDPLLAKSFVNSLLTVALCSVWPTLINTAVGVTSVDKDLLNVSKVLQLSWWRHIRTIVLPSAIPMMFTGLRLSLGIAWMVLIAAEMLAQNPGLGKFVWDEFQNGSSDSLGRIMVAVIVIGLIGLLLDRGMLQCQRWLSWNKQTALR